MYKHLSICNANILRVFLFGILAGMNFLLSGNTLNFWLASYGVDTKIIGFFACVTFPYACKYIIAVFIDKFGLYKNWMIASQLALVIFLSGLSLLNPEENLSLIAVLSFFISLASVIQYVIFNGDRINTLSEAEQAPGSAMYNVGYRIGMFITGVGVIYISTYIRWSSIYLILAAVYALLFALIYYYYDNKIQAVHNEISQNNTSILHDMFIKPVKYFSGYKNLIWVALFALVYQMSDSMFMTMLNPFLLFKGYNAEEIASASKFFGIIMVIIGGIVSGSMVNRLGIRKSLIIFIFLHMFGYLQYIILVIMNKDVASLYFATGFVAFTGGMATTAYTTFISGLANGNNAATTYAFITSITGLSWILFPSISGILVDAYGWLIFFIIIAMLTFLISVFTYFIPDKIYQIYKNPSVN